MQIPFVDHHDARMLQCGLVTEIVKNVVADLVQRDVELRGVEALRVPYGTRPQRSRAGG